MENNENKKNILQMQNILFKKSSLNKKNIIENIYYKKSLSNCNIHINNNNNYNKYNNNNSFSGNINNTNDNNNNNNNNYQKRTKRNSSNISDINTKNSSFTHNSISKINIPINNFSPFEKKINNNYINHINDNSIYNNNNNNIKIINSNLDVYQKQMAKKLKTEIQLEQKRKEKILKELKEIKKIPKINNNSRKLSKNNLPIYQRLKLIEKKHNENIDKIKQEIFFENFITNTKFNNNNKKYDENEFKCWINKNENWNMNRQIKRENIKREFKIQENEEEYFKPNININSINIMKTKNESFIERQSFILEDKENKINEIKKKLTPSFTPNINKNYKISEKYYDFMKYDQIKIYNNHNNNNN